MISKTRTMTAIGTALAVAILPLAAAPAAADPVVDDLGKMMYSKAAAGTPVVDGVRDSDYDDTAVLSPIRVKNGLSTSATGEFEVLWDAGHLYVHAEVTDALINTAHTNTWERDSIEIFVEEDNGRKDIYGDGDHRIRIVADGAVDILSSTLAPGDVVVEHTLTGTGYAIEVSIDLALITAAADTVIGFDLQINDADATAKRVGLLGWNDYLDNAGKYPKDMGQLQLVAGPTTPADTVLVDYPARVAIPPVDFSSTTVLQPGDVRLLAHESTEPLLNSGKGWIVYGDTANWGRPNLQTAETLALATTGYYRFNWYEIEPEDDVYNWDVIDDTIEAWDALGKTFAFGVINANTARPNVRYVTPEWVEDAGAQFVEVDIEFNLDDEVEGEQMVPVWNDPVYIEKLDDFVEALGDRYDGDPRVEFIDIRSYGNYGENHVWGISESPDPARRSQLISDADFQTMHVDTYVSHFPTTQLMLPKGNTVHEAVITGAPDDGVGLRFDAAIAHFPYFTAEASTQVPVVYEFVGSYAFLKATGGWSDDAFLRGFPQGNPSYIGMGQYGADAAFFLSEKRALIEQGANLMGFHWVLNDVILDEQAEPGIPTPVVLNWANKGFAPVYEDVEVALALVDSAGEIVDEPMWLDDLQPQEWLPRTVTEEATDIELPVVADGTYSLVVGLFADKDDDDPAYRIGNRNPTPSGWYTVTSSVVVSGGDYTFASDDELPINVVIDGRLQAYSTPPVLDGATVRIPLLETLDALGADAVVTGSSIAVTPAEGDPFTLTVGPGGVTDIGGLVFVEPGSLAEPLNVDTAWDEPSRTLAIDEHVDEPEFVASHEWTDGTSVVREAAFAFDGSTATSWVAGVVPSTVSSQNPVWVQRNFAEPTTFDTIEITEHAGTSAGEIGSYALQYWDGSSWQIIESGTDLTPGAKGSTTTFEFEPVTTTRFRLLVTSASVGFVNVREIATSLAPEYAASHEWTDSTSLVRAASFAFDGDPATSWVADVAPAGVTPSSPVWVQRNFDEPTSFDTVTITEHSASSAGEIGAFELQYWDGSAWQSAASGADLTTAAKGSASVYVIDPVTTTKFRLLATSASVGFVNVREIAFSQTPEFAASHEWTDSTNVLRQAAFAFDGSTATSWVAGAAPSTVTPAAPVWIQRRYASEQTVDTVAITEHPAATAGEITQFTVQYLAEGRWQTAYTGGEVSTGVKGDPHPFVFDAVDAHLFRVVVTGATTGFVNVREIVFN